MSGRALGWGVGRGTLLSVGSNCFSLEARIIPEVCPSHFDTDHSAKFDHCIVCFVFASVFISCNKKLNISYFIALLL